MKQDLRKKTLAGTRPRK